MPRKENEESLEALETQNCPPMIFLEMISLERIDDWTFKSNHGALTGFNITINGVKRPTAYGGHIQAQALWAASQTVPAGLVAHSVTGYYTSRGLADRRFTYEVRAIKTGRSYCQRAVDVRQAGSSEICYSNICSFKRSAPDDVYSLQGARDIKSTYAEVMRRMHPADFPVQSEFKSSADFFSGTGFARTWRFGGLSVAMIPMKAFNKDKHPLERRTLFAYAGQGELPSTTTHANLHAAAHLFASDRESTYVIVRHLGVIQNLKASATISQTTHFHGGADLISLLPTSPLPSSTPTTTTTTPQSGDDSDSNEKGEDRKGKREKWFYQEIETPRAGDGRATHQSRIWDDTGRHVATTIQDVMFQLDFDSEEKVQKKLDAYPAPTPASAAPPSWKI